MTRLDYLKQEFLSIVAMCEDDVSDDNIEGMTSDELLRFSEYVGNQHIGEYASGTHSYAQYHKNAGKRYFFFCDRHKDEDFRDDNIAVLMKRYGLA